MSKAAEDLVRRLSATVRASELYAPTHPLVQRTAGGLLAALAPMLTDVPAVIVGFLEDDVVVNDFRLPRGSANMAGLLRDMRDRKVEKITFARGVEVADIRALMDELADRTSRTAVGDRLTARGIRRVQVSKVAVEDEDEEPVGLAQAKQMYSKAVASAETIWAATKAGEQPDPANARGIIDSLSRLVYQDRTSLLALTALKRHDNYTFTHMVNVAALSMAMARSLELEGPMLREFGFAALMHDIGKVHTPLEILNKPDKLNDEEFKIMKQHVIDGAHVLRRTPETPALAPLVAFEHHLKQDLSGYPENVGARKLNLCTMVVTVVDVFDALRSNRAYRQGLATDRIKHIMSQQESTTFNKTLLRRFVNLMGLFPIGTLVRLNTEEVGVVTQTHRDDPFRPQVKLIMNGKGEKLETPLLTNTWDRDVRGEFPRAVVEAIDPEQVGIDPLSYL
ncbi:MAG TPA: HD domain-containing phosphohydrolase [Vicinamibacterales bacterium]|nr:HD domain-containing phosphohydrolase [Vicinamibacterales bacterium]